MSELSVVRPKDVERCVHLKLEIKDKHIFYKLKLQSIWLREQPGSGSRSRGGSRKDPHQSAFGNTRACIHTIAVQSKILHTQSTM